MIPGEISIALVLEVRTEDNHGNYTSTWSIDRVDGCLFEPEQTTERTDSRSPGVTAPARLYMPAGAAPNIDDISMIVIPFAGVALVDDKPVVTGEAWSVQGNVERWPQVVASLTRWKQR